MCLVHGASAGLRFAPPHQLTFVLSNTPCRTEYLTSKRPAACHQLFAAPLPTSRSWLELPGLVQSTGLEFDDRPVETGSSLDQTPISLASAVSAPPGHSLHQTTALSIDSSRAVQSQTSAAVAIATASSYYVPSSNAPKNLSREVFTPARTCREPWQLGGASSLPH